MINSAFLSIGFHIFFIVIAYFGLPIIKTNEIIEQPIDIVEDTPVSSKTSLKLGNIKKNKLNEVNKKKKKKIRKKKRKKKF